MGSGSNRNPAGGFFTLEWESEPNTIAGIKVVYNVNNRRSNDLPAYSNKSFMYFKRDEKSSEISQLRIYNNQHEAMLDIDINPSKPHRNSDGTIIPAGVTHVHEWIKDRKGRLIRNKDARLMTDSEYLQYDTFLSAAVKQVKYK